MDGEAREFDGPSTPFSGNGGPLSPVASTWTWTWMATGLAGTALATGLAGAALELHTGTALELHTGTALELDTGSVLSL